MRRIKSITAALLMLAMLSGCGSSSGQPNVTRGEAPGFTPSASAEIVPAPAPDPEPEPTEPPQQEDKSVETAPVAEPVAEPITEPEPAPVQEPEPAQEPAPEEPEPQPIQAITPTEPDAPTEQIDRTTPAVTEPEPAAPTEPTNADIRSAVMDCLTQVYSEDAVQSIRISDDRIEVRIKTDCSADDDAPDNWDSIKQTASEMSAKVASALPAGVTKGTIAVFLLAKTEGNLLAAANGEVTYDAYPAPIIAVEPEPAAPAERSTPTTSTGATYIGNSNTKKFHRPSCSSVDKIKESNKVTLYSRESAISQGYTACKNFKP